MLAIIPSWLKIAAVGLLCAALASWASYGVGKREGRQQAAVSALERSVTVLRERGEINEDVSRADASRLCADFGLSEDDERECVRRLGSSDTQPDDRRDDRSD